MEELLLLINEQLFSDFDKDEFYKWRDDETFDSEYCRIYKLIETKKTDDRYSPEMKEQNDLLREKVFRKVYELCEDGDVAGYISDDFGLIIDGLALDIKDDWFLSFVDSYRNCKFPK